MLIAYNFNISSKWFELLNTIMLYDFPWNQFFSKNVDLTEKCRFEYKSYRACLLVITNVRTNKVNKVYNSRQIIFMSFLWCPLECAQSKQMRRKTISAKVIEMKYYCSNEKKSKEQVYWPAWANTMWSRQRFINSFKKPKS